MSLENTNIEQGISLPSRTISLLNELKDPPSNLKVSDKNGQSKEMIVVINGQLFQTIINLGSKYR